MREYPDNNSGSERFTTDPGRGYRLSRRALLTGSTAVGFGALLSTVGGAARAVATDDAEAARAAMDRLVPQLSGKLTVRLLPSTGTDTFRIEGRDGAVVLSGTSTIALLSALRHYLESTGVGHLSRHGDRISPRLIVPGTRIEMSSPYPLRYTYNMTAAGYQTPYLDWSQWERELDFLAYSGINTALMLIGQEICWIDAFTASGYTRDEIVGWLTGPAHLPWQWAGNCASIGSYPGWEYAQRRAELGGRILDRMRELGITPVVPGYSGIVPPGFADRNPGAQVLPGGLWVAGPAPDLVDPRTDGYAGLAELFYRAQRTRFGHTPFKYIPMFHENVTLPELYDPAAAARGIQQALAHDGDDWKWVMEGWLNAPLQSILDAVPAGRALVVDLTGDAHTARRDYAPHDWVCGALQNFGQRMQLYGPLAEYGVKWTAALSDPSHGALCGVGITSEGTDTNPVVWSFLTGMFWRQSRPDVSAWLRDFVTARYGAEDADALAAWRILLDTAYSHGSLPKYQGGAGSLLTAPPDLDARVAGSTAPPDLVYAPGALEPAVTALLAAADRLRAVDPYRYDLIDVTRQMIADRARILLPHIKAAFGARDANRFRQQSQEFLALFDIQDRVAATRPEFLLGRWISAAIAAGTDDAERGALEQDARLVLTTWANRWQVGLLDYANREWSGLLTAYYKPRWEHYFEQLERVVPLGLSLPAVPDDLAPLGIGAQAEDWYAYGERFWRSTTRFADSPTGDSVSAAAAAARILGLPTS
ncbi:alpha-N-acetylglucosaminidase TIM-barrel domain-containing protein [Nocardia sp. NPDC052566]|uniref:alpha-N-acetylglucosaminidase n=1 Tax=Nocardia sp. NPDC052566 TaxID=3364330 RepID=UPI0037CC80BB